MYWGRFASEDFFVSEDIFASDFFVKKRASIGIFYGPDGSDDEYDYQVTMIYYIHIYVYIYI